MEENSNIEQLIVQLSSDNISVKNKARDLLIYIGSPAIPPLIEAMSTGNDLMMTSCIRILAELQAREALDPIVDALYHENRLIRETAASALGAIGDRRAGDALLKRLSHEHRLVQVWIIDSLGKIGEHRAIPDLMDILQTTDHPQIMYMCIRALTKLNAKEALDLIKSFADFDEHHVRNDVQEAIRALS